LNGKGCNQSGSYSFQISERLTTPFRLQFKEVGVHLEMATAANFLTIADSVRAVGDVMTTYALASDSTAWPNVNMPSSQFDHHVAHVRSPSSINALWTSPIVTDLGSWAHAQKKLDRGMYPMSHATFEYSEAKTKVLVKGRTAAPIHQMYPSPYNIVPGMNISMLNFDMLSEPGMNETFTVAGARNQTQLSNLTSLTILRDTYPGSLTQEEPLSILVHPIYSNFDNGTVVGYVQSIVQWKHILSEVLEDSEAAYAVVSAKCHDIESFFTIKVTGPTAEFQGTGDTRKAKFDKHVKTVSISLGTPDEGYGSEGDASCKYTMLLYPTEELSASYDSKRPQLYTTIIGAVFFIMAATFFSYDRYVHLRVWVVSIFWFNVLNLCYISKLQLREAP
jgi:hypothetical protein